MRELILFYRAGGRDTDADRAGVSRAGIAQRRITQVYPGQAVSEEGVGMNCTERLELRKISSLDCRGAALRIHSAEQIEGLCRSLREFGFVTPVLITGDGVVLDGCAMLEAARLEGWDSVPCAVEEHLTAEQEKAYRLACHRLQEETVWDMALVSQQLSDLEAAGFDITLTGFSAEDIQLGECPDVQEDDFVPDVPKVAKAKPGELYRLGDHLLLCGDCTDTVQVHRLLDGAKANCIVTDPPYNMNYHGAGKSRRDGIENDNMPEAEFAVFLQRAFAAMADAMEDGGSLYCFYKELGGGTFLTSLRSAGLTFKQELVWVKNGIVLGGAKYQNMYEPFLFACKGDSVGTWNGGRTERSVIEQVDLMNEEELRQAVKDLLACEPTDVIRERKPLKSDLHPTMKPVRLLARLIRNSTHNGGTVFDPFAGSGSTMVACQQLGRRCLMMELDPRYVDVIIDRYIALTGDKDGVVQLA